MDPYPSIPILSLNPYSGIPLILLLIVINALLTAGQCALTVISDSSIKKLAASGDEKYRFILRLLERPASFLEGIKLASFTCTLCITIWGWQALASLLIRLVNPLVAWLPAAALQIVPAVLAFVVTALLINVLCHLLPHRIACRHPQSVARVLARFCSVAARIFWPLALLCNAVTSLLTRLLGVRREDEPEQVTEEEIRLMVDVGKEKGAIEQSEKEMINNIFEFDDRCVSEVMTHRTDMTATSRDAALGDIVSMAIETGFSRIPIYEDSIDNIVGIIYVKDLLCLIGTHEGEFHAGSYMRPVLFVPENMSCIDLFAQFKLSKVMIAIAVDEYGGTAGLVSMEDLLESIVGNIQDEYDDEEEEISPLGDGCYSIDGAVSISDVERLFDIDLDEESEYDTIGGLITETLQRIPAPDEHPSVELSGILFTVLLVEERRIARIRAEHPKEPEGDGE